MNAPRSNYLFQEELYSFTAALIVVLPKPLASLTSDERALLNRILKSVKLDENGVQILEHSSVDLSSMQNYSPARVLIFGASMTEEIEQYRSTTAHGFTVIRADDLSQLDDQKKKDLWLALREMFGV